jgi:hypothetical protein
MKKSIYLLTVSILILCIVFIGSNFSSCFNNKKDSLVMTPLKEINTVYDKYGNLIQQILYNEQSGNHFIKEFIYEYQNGAWVCIEQRTNVFSENDYKHYFTNPLLEVYYKKDLNTGPIAIMDNEYVRIDIVEYLSTASWWEFGYKFRVINKTNEVITMMLDNTSIMSIQCKPLFNIDHIDAGKTIYFNMAWDKEALERSYIPYIDNIEFIIKIFNNENWTTPALVGSHILIKN